MYRDSINLGGGGFVFHSGSSPLVFKRRVQANVSTLSFSKSSHVDIDSFNTFLCVSFSAYLRMSRGFSTISLKWIKALAWSPLNSGIDGHRPDGTHSVAVTPNRWLLLDGCSIPPKLESIRHWGVLIEVHVP